MALGLRRRTEVILGLGLLVLIGTGAGWYGLAVGRWRCPSDEELRRPLTQDEVVNEFRERGVVLRWTRQHGRITTYHSSAGEATVWVNVCSELCQPDDGRITKRKRPVGPAIFVRNIGIAVTGEWAAATPLVGKVAAVTDAVDGPNAGERCYIG